MNPEVETPILLLRNLVAVAILSRRALLKTVMSCA